MTIRYDKDAVKVRDSLVPIGVAGLLMASTGLGCLLYDSIAAGAFWGWGILGLIAVSLLVSGWVATCYKIVFIDRKADLVGVVYRGGYKFRDSQSLWTKQKLERPLSTYCRVITNRHFESQDEGSGQVAIYTIALEPKLSGLGQRQEDPFPIYRHANESFVLKEMEKLATFLGFPHRKTTRRSESL